MGRCGLRRIFGWYPNQNSNARYVSECVIAQGSENDGARVFRLTNPAPTTCIARDEDSSSPPSCAQEKGSRSVGLRPFAP